MRVLIVTSEFHPRAGGIERYVADMAQSLSDRVDVGLIIGPEQFPPPGSSYTIAGRLNLASPVDPGAFKTMTSESTETVDELIGDPFDIRILHRSVQQQTQQGPALLRRQRRGFGLLDSLRAAQDRIHGGLVVCAP